jgi:hypothetical protein
MTILYHWTKDTHYNKAFDNASKEVVSDVTRIEFKKNSSIILRFHSLQKNKRPPAQHP